MRMKMLCAVVVVIATAQAPFLAKQGLITKQSSSQE